MLSLEKYGLGSFPLTVSFGTGSESYFFVIYIEGGKFSKAILIFGTTQKIFK